MWFERPERPFSLYDKLSDGLENYGTFSQSKKKKVANKNLFSSNEDRMGKGVEWNGMGQKVTKQHCDFFFFATLK